MTTDNVIQLKSSTSTGNTPINGCALSAGEIAINRADHQLYYLDDTPNLLTAELVNTTNRLGSALIADGSVSDTEFQYINSLSSNAQTQITARLPLAGGTMSGAIAMGGNNITGGGTGAFTALTATGVTTLGGNLPKQIDVQYDSSNALAFAIEADGKSVLVTRGTDDEFEISSPKTTITNNLYATLVGDVTGNVTGNASGSSATCSGLAATATALATARAINGTNFDGSAAITITAAGSTLSDTVTVAKGGTGATTLTSGGLLYGNGTSAVAGSDYISITEDTDAPGLTLTTDSDTDGDCGFLKFVKNVAMDSGDVIGKITWYGLDAQGGSDGWAAISAIVDDSTNNGEDADLCFTTTHGGTEYTQRNRFIGNTDYYWPPDEGSADEVLSTNGSGVLTWESLSGLSGGGENNQTITTGDGVGGANSGSSGNFTIAVNAAQTGITSVVNTSLEIGRDADNRIKFGTDNQIIFEVSGGDNVIFKASGEIEATSLDIGSGGVDVNGTLETNTLTVGGTNVLTGSLITTLGTISSGVWNGTAITSSYIGADAITAAKIGDNVLNSEHYAAGSIDAEHLASDSVTEAKMAANSVDSQAYVDDSIDTAHYAAGSVDTTALGADCVTAAKIGDNVLNSEHYAAGSIDAEHLASDSVTEAKMAANSVDSQAYVDNSIDTAHYAANSVDADALNVSDDGTSGYSLTSDGDGSFSWTNVSSGGSGDITGVTAGAGLSGGGSSGGVTLAVDVSEFSAVTPASGDSFLTLDNDGSTEQRTTVDALATLLAGGNISASSGVLSSTDTTYSAGNSGLVPPQPASSPTLKFLRGDGTFTVPTDSNTTYSGGTGLTLSTTTFNVDASQTQITAVGTIGTGVWNGTAITANYIGADAITAAKIGDNVINSEHYAAGSIDNEHLADDAVDSDELAAGSVDTAHLSADCVTAAKIGDNVLNSEHYAAASIDNEHLAANSVDSSNYVDDSIDTAHYAAGSVDATALGADCVTAAKIGDNVINSEHYAAGSIDLEHMASQSVDEDNLYISNSGSNGQFLSKQSGNNGGLTWATPAGGGSNADTVTVTAETSDSSCSLLFVTDTNGELAAKTNTGLTLDSTNGKLSGTFVGNLTGTASNATTVTNDAITGAKIADNAIDSEHYTDGSIDNAHIADNAIDSEHYADGSIDNAHIADNAIDSEHYADGSIDNAHIADNAIDSEHYADGSIDNAHIADDAIGSEHYAAGSVDTTALGADAVTAAKIADDAISEEHLDPTIISALADTTIADADYVMFWDATDSALKKVDAAELTAGGGGSGATQPLDNLASVAINTTLVSDTDNTDDLGTSSIYWKDIYFKGNMITSAGNGLSSGYDIVMGVSLIPLAPGVYDVAATTQNFTFTNGILTRVL